MTSLNSFPEIVSFSEINFDKFKDLLKYIDENSNVEANNELNSLQKRLDDFLTNLTIYNIKYNKKLRPEDIFYNFRAYYPTSTPNDNSSHLYKELVSIYRDSQEKYELLRSDNFKKSIDKIRNELSDEKKVVFNSFIEAYCDDYCNDSKYLPSIRFEALIKLFEKHDENSINVFKACMELFNKKDIELIDLECLYTEYEKNDEMRKTFSTAIFTSLILAFLPLLIIFFASFLVMFFGRSKNIELAIFLAAATLIALSFFAYTVFSLSTALVFGGILAVVITLPLVIFGALALLTYRSMNSYEKKMADAPVLITLSDKVIPKNEINNQIGDIKMRGATNPEAFFKTGTFQKRETAIEDIISIAKNQTAA